VPIFRLAGKAPLFTLHSKSRQKHQPLLKNS